MQVVSYYKLLATKGTVKMYVDVAGKNLPYFDRDGQKQAFPWETHICPNRLKNVEAEAQRHKAEAWLAFCYAILSDQFKKCFKTIVNVQGRSFGAKLIRTSQYRKYMRPRSQSSWGVVELPRNDVVRVTSDPQDVCS
jgi:hypothetical protein